MPTWLSLLGLCLAAGCVAPSPGGGDGLFVRGKADSGDTGTPVSTLDMGPFSGGLTDTSAKVWARLADVGEARVVLAPDPSFATDLTWSDAATSDPASDYTLQWEFTGLEPRTTYYYQVVMGADAPVASTSTASSRFTTFASPGDDVDLNFVIFADNNSEGLSDAYESASLEGPDLAFQIGDFDHRNPYDSGLDIENWRVQNQENLWTDYSGQQLADYILLRTPFFHTWDDHDFGDNDGDATAPYRDIAMQAFREYFLTGELPNPDDGFWYSFRHGQAEFFMLDTRSQRDPNTSRSTRSKSMLGATQLAWLENGLRDSTATWKFILSSSLWNPTGKANDSWNSFPRERRKLRSFITLNGIEGVVIISADIHSGGGIDDGTNSWLPELTVPPTNLFGFSCTGDCGDWSEGVYDEYYRWGYAAVDVSYDPSTGVHTCELAARAPDGSTRVSYTLTR